MNCIYLKQKINRTLECKKRKKIINIKECNNCKYKEYKCTEFSKNSANSTLKNTTLHNKSAKLTKLERNRFSVFTNNRHKCMFCPSTYNLTWHECFSGSNRQKSMQYGFCLRMCESCHSKFQEDKNFNDYWHARCREYWLEHLGTLNEFIKEFGKSYLIKK